MVAAILQPSVTKRAWADVFTPPSGYHPAIGKSEVTAEEILEGGIREDDWSFPVIISTPNEDRVGDVVVPEGCIYKDFASSPILFFDHQNIKFPVGSFRSPHDGRLYFAVEPGRGIIGRIWMFREENTKHYEVCKDLFYLVKTGLINGVSVGFEPRGQVKSLPSGGNLYSQWELLEVSLVAIPANSDCTVIRHYLDDSRRKGKTFHPLVLKSLTAMTTETETPVTKAMEESSSTAGGATVPEEGTPAPKTREAITERMADHKDGETGGTHEAHFHEESGVVHHVHGADASPEHLKSVYEDLADVPGVSEVRQSTERPKEGAGFESVYPPEGHDGNVHKDMDEAAVEESARVAVEKAAQKAAARAARIAALVESGKHVQRLLKSGVIAWTVKKSTEDCVSQKIKYLHDSGEAAKKGWADDQIAAIAYHYCGEKKGLLQFIAKALPTKPEGAGDAAAAREDEEHEEPMDEAAEGGRPGVLAFQTILENLEAMLDNQEPEVGELLQEIIQLTRDHAEERYPDEEFGGAERPDPAENRANEAAEQEQTNEELSRYRAKGNTPRRTKRYVAAQRLKALRRAVSEDHAHALHKAASHMHAIGDMPAQEIEHRGHPGMFLKGYTMKHHADCRVMGRKLDRLHGAIAKAEDEVHEDDKLTREDHQPGDKIETVEKGIDLDLSDPQLLSLLRDVAQQYQAGDDKVSQLQLRAGRTA